MKGNLRLSMCRAGELEEPVSLAEEDPEQKCRIRLQGRPLLFRRIRPLSEAETSWRDHTQCFSLSTLLLR